MKKLEFHQRKNRFDYYRVARALCNDGKIIYIYKQTENEGKTFVGYEVFVARIQKTDVTTPSNVVIPAGEKFAADRQFGETAWSTGPKIEAAFRKMNELIEQHEGLNGTIEKD